MDVFNIISDAVSPLAIELFGYNTGLSLSLFYIASFIVLWLLSHPLEKAVLYFFRSRRNTESLDARLQMLRTAIRTPFRIVFSLAVAHALSTSLNFPQEFRLIINQFFRISMILFGAWMGRRIISGSTSLMEENLNPQDDDWKIRESRTRIIVFRRVSSFVIALLGIGLILEGFDSVRELGMSILASAGIAGIVFGFAAQKSISSLIAGLQLALMQPVRIGDTVIVDGYWGKVEEIGLTHVVIRIWDLRRLVVPIHKFLDEPFENWTRASPQIMGTVFIYADYTVPVDAVREELHRIVVDNPLWNRESCSLLVTNATERTVELRAVVSAADASQLWDLRCEVREKLIAFLRDYEDGVYLPRIRFGENSNTQFP